MSAPVTLATRRFGDERDRARPANVVTHRPARVRGADAAARSSTRGSTWLTFSLLVRALDHRRARRLARPARRHDSLRRVPRSARRQVPRARRVLRARRSAATSRGPRWPSSPCARSSSRVPLVRGRSAASRCRRGGSGSGRRSSSSSPWASCSCPPTYEWATFHDVLLWFAVALSVVSGLDIVISGYRAPEREPSGRARISMRCDVLAIGTELLLGQIVDTNSAWIGEQLAAVGIDTCEHRKVGDNLARMVQCLRELLDARRRGDRVRRHRAHARRRDPGGDRRGDGRRARAARGAHRAHPLDLRRPRPADAREQPAPGRRARGRRRDPEPDRHRARVCAARWTRERRDEGRVRGARRARTRCSRWSREHVLPDLLERSGERAVIVSRSLKTWGTSESGLAEMIAERVDEQTQPDDRVPRPWHRGHLRAHDGEGADRGRGARAARRRRRRAAHGARRARLRGRRRDDGVRGAAALRGARAGRSASPSRSPAGSSARASPTCPARVGRSADRSRRTRPR